MLTMADINTDNYVDITDCVCPMTFVKSKIALDELEVGDILCIHMNDGEPLYNVPRSIKEDGHDILKITKNDDGTYDVLVKKGNE